MQYNGKSIHYSEVCAWYGSLRFDEVTKNKRYFVMGMSYADTQWTLPENPTPETKAWSDKGFTWETRLWIDEMFMITIVQSQAFRALFCHTSAGEWDRYSLHSEFTWTFGHKNH